MEKEKWAEHFTGQPFRDHLAVMDAIYHGGIAPLTLRMPEIMEKGWICPQCEKTLPDGGVVLLQYPENGEARLGVLLLKNEEEKTLDVAGVFPMLQGLPNELKLLNHKEFANGLEGVVVAVPARGPALQFFDPLYFIEQGKFNKGASQAFSLAAAALSAEKTEDATLFLKPGGNIGEWQFRASVEKSEELEFMGRKLFRLRLSFGAESPAQIPLYAAEHAVKGEIPRPGDMAEGFLWLEGSLTREA